MRNTGKDKVVSVADREQKRVRESDFWWLLRPKFRVYTFIAVAALALAYMAAFVERPVDYPLARDYLLEGPVSHYRDGDTIEVNGMAVRFARLDCLEMNTGEGLSSREIAEPFRDMADHLAKVRFGRR